jgi:hypothetical protein
MKSSADQKATSDHYPGIEHLQDQIIIPYQINEFEKDGMKGWEYYEHRIPVSGQVPEDAAAFVIELESKIIMQNEALSLLSDLKYPDIDKHIDQAFASLSTIQKTSLKRLYKAVLYLLKEHN